MIEQTAVSYLIAVAEAYGRARGMRLSAVSRQIYGNSGFFGSLRRGEASMTLRRYAKTLEAFAQGWPDGAAWPRPVTLRLGRPAKRG